MKKEKVLNKFQKPDTIYTWRGWKNGISQDIVLKTTKMKTINQKDRENNENIFLFFIIRKLKIWGRKELWSKILYTMKRCVQISLVKILYSHFQLFTLIKKEWINCDKTYKQAKLKKICSVYQTNFPTIKNLGRKNSTKFIKVEILPVFKRAKQRVHAWFKTRHAYQWCPCTRRVTPTLTKKKNRNNIKVFKQNERKRKWVI